MRAWEKLIGGSTIASGDAWAHLQAQGGGATQVVYVERVDANFSEIVLSGLISDGAMTSNILIQTAAANVLSEVADGSLAAIILSGLEANMSLSTNVTSLELSGVFLEEII